LGNGGITTADWVQAGRYAAGLDTLVRAGGPTGPASAKLAVLSAGPRVTGARTVRAVSDTFQRGQTDSLLVELDAQGDENALGFSLVYDPQVLQFKEAHLGGGASGATLNPNLNQSASGRLGIGLALPAGQKFAAGTRTIVVVSFTVPAEGPTVTTTVSFGDQPIFREIVDVLATSLNTSYINASVKIMLLKVGDFNGDGEINFDDFFLFANRFGTKRGDTRFDSKYDLNSDGEVNFDDFFLFAAAFGK